MDGTLGKQQTYLAYMVRLWQAGSREGKPLWRGSLEDPHTGERLAFGDAAALFTYLAERMSSLVTLNGEAELAGQTSGQDAASPPPHDD